MKKSRLNNMKMGFHRNEIMYEVIMTDLYLMGALPKDVVEKFIGREIPDFLQLPASFKKEDAVEALETLEPVNPEPEPINPEPEPVNPEPEPINPEPEPV